MNKRGLMLCALVLCTALYGMPGVFAIDLGRGIWFGALVRTGGAYEYNKDGDGAEANTTGWLYPYTKGDPFWELEIKQDGVFGASFTFKSDIQPVDVRPCLWVNLGPFRVTAGRFDAFRIDRYGLWGENAHMGDTNGVDFTWNTPLEGLRVNWIAPVFEAYEDNHPGGYYAIENMLGESTFGISYDQRWFSGRFALRLADWENVPDVMAERDNKTMRAIWELMLNNVRFLDAGVAGEAFRINDDEKASVFNYFKAIFDLTNTLPVTMAVNKLRLGLRANVSVEHGLAWWTGGAYGDREYDRHTKVEGLLYTELNLFGPLTWAFETGPLFRAFDGWDIVDTDNPRLAQKLSNNRDWRTEYSLKTNFRYDFSDRFNVQLQYRWWHRFEDPDAVFALTPVDNHTVALWAMLTYN
jgi:hypothetical protein